MRSSLARRLPAGWGAFACFAVAALFLRLVLAFALGTNGDIENAEKVAGWIAGSPLNVYRREHYGALAWPYGPGYFPVLVVSRALHRWLDIGFASLFRLPAIAANIVLAGLVHSELGRLGVTRRWQLAGVVGILFGPLFVLESGWHGQLDTVAITLAVAGVLAWCRLDGDRRPVVAGVLIALAGLVKTVPALTLIPLVASARSRRELVLLLGTAGGLALLAIAPWLIAERSAVTQRLDYQGVPGIAGLSLLIQPQLAHVWLNGDHVGFTSLQLHLQHHRETLTLAVLALTSAVVLITRPRPAAGMVMLSLGVLVSAADPSLQYLIWLIPFVILAGWVRAATVLQLALVAPVAIFYLPAIDHTLSSPASPWSHAVTNLVYVPSMDGLWLAGVLALLVMLAREVRTWSVAHRGAAQPSRPT